MKKIYNIILNSADTTNNNFSGLIYDAVFNCDLSPIISNNSFKSSYKLTWRMKSVGMQQVAYEPNTSNLVLQLGLGRTYNNVYNGNFSNIVGVCHLNWEGVALNTNNHNYSIDTFPNHNPPIFIENLQNNINSISVKIFNSALNQLHITQTNYVLILSFEEL